MYVVLKLVSSQGELVRVRVKAGGQLSMAEQNFPHAPRILVSLFLWDDLKAPSNTSPPAGHTRLALDRMGW